MWTIFSAFRMTALHLVVESLSINTMNYESIIDGKGFINSESTKVETLHHLAMPRYSVHKNYEQTVLPPKTESDLLLMLGTSLSLWLYRDLIAHNNLT